MSACARIEKGAQFGAHALKVLSYSVTSFSPTTEGECGGGKEKCGRVYEVGVEKCGGWEVCERVLECKGR